MKTIVAIWHAADKGKTETLRELAHLMMYRYTFKSIEPIPANVSAKGDFRLVLEINRKIIAIESKGDPNTEMKKRLNEIDTQYNPDIIICSTRTKGDTVIAVDDLANKKGYQIIWTSTYQMASNHKQANELKAKHVLDLLQNLQLI